MKWLVIRRALALVVPHLATAGAAALVTAELLTPEAANALVVLVQALGAQFGL